MITIENLEALASRLEATDKEQRAKLLRLIAAYARIIKAREPRQFRRRALEWSDEDGHWDNSYPPTIKYKDFRGPALIKVRHFASDEAATSDGYYHDYRVYTTDPGLYVDAAGHIYGCDIQGTGSVGSYAAHPGACNVRCELGWDIRPMDDADEVTLTELAEAEQHLREIAFPLASAAMAD